MAIFSIFKKKTPSASSASVGSTSLVKTGRGNLFTGKTATALKGVDWGSALNGVGSAISKVTQKSQDINDKVQLYGSSLAADVALHQEFLDSTPIYKRDWFKWVLIVPVLITAVWFVVKKVFNKRTSKRRF